MLPKLHGLHEVLDLDISQCYHCTVNTRNRETLQAIFATPTPTNLRWIAIEGLFLALGAEVTEGAGSRVRVALNGVRQVFHRPHPHPTAGRATVRDVRDFLTRAGVQP